MAKNEKYRFFKRERGDDVNALLQKIKRTYENKYYNVWMSKFEWKGLDEEQKEEQENYIMRKFWCDGTVACRKIDSLDMLGYMPYAVGQWNMYDFPAIVNLTNLRGVSEVLIPNTPQVVNKDVVLIWCNPAHKPIAEIVRHYVDRIAQVEMVINTNLNLSKMPFLIGVSPDDKDRMENVVDSILNNEVVVFADLEDLSRIQSLATATPFIVDKLKAYSRDLENELLTFLGVDNIGQEKGERLLVDEANSNNDMINAYGSAIEDEINKGLDNIKRIFNKSVSIKCKCKPVQSESMKGANNGGLQSGDAKSHPQDKSMEE